MILGPKNHDSLAKTNVIFTANCGFGIVSEKEKKKTYFFLMIPAQVYEILPSFTPLESCVEEE